MRIYVLARHWGGPDGGPDGMAVAVSYFAWTLCELGHDVHGFIASDEKAPWIHERMMWTARPGLDAPPDFAADLVITAIAPVWRRTAAAAARAGACDRLVFWHHHGDVPEGYGCRLASPAPATTARGWTKTAVLPPSSWAVEQGGARRGDAVLVPGAGRMKGGHVALEVARQMAGVPWFVLPGRSGPVDIAPWKALPNAEVAPGRLPPATFLDRARVVLSPTRAEVHPLTLVEAAVRGIPIVCTDLEATRRAAPGATFVPMSAPPEAWASAVRGALEASPAPLCLRPYREVVTEVLVDLAPDQTPVRAAAVLHRRGSRPRVAIIADVRTWAWARKSEQLRQHLAGDFDVEIAYVYDKKPDPIPLGADLYHTFEVFMAPRLPEALPYTTGITAHVWDGHLQKFGDASIRRIIGGARAFHANSLLLVEETRRRFGIESYYVPNGVDETFFRRTRERRPSGRLVVGFQGKPNPRKGGALIAEACRLAGVELRANERTHRDALDASGMREFYQDLHVLAVQSDMDGTPNSALEAAACGVAVVSNRIGNMPEFIEHGRNGLLVGRSAESLAAALRELAADLPRAIEMGRAARATIERAWTWRDLSVNYARMWRDALEARGAARRVA